MRTRLPFNAISEWVGRKPFMRVALIRRAKLPLTPAAAFMSDGLRSAALGIHEGTGPLQLPAVMV